MSNMNMPNQVDVACPSCSVTFKAKSDLAGRRVKCPKCQFAIKVPEIEPQKDIVTFSPAPIRLLFLGGIGLVLLAVGAGAGLVVGHIKGKTDYSKELLEAKNLSQMMDGKLQIAETNGTKKLQIAEANISKVESERDNLKSELTMVTKDRDQKLAEALQREIDANIKVREAEQKLAVIATSEMAAVAKRQADERQKAEAWKQVETVQVTTVKEALAIHENPKDYVGKKVVVSKEIAFIDGGNFQRHAESKGYLFTWRCGATASGAESLGNQFGCQPRQLNYWCDTDSGLLAKEKLKVQFVGANIIYNRIGLTFEIKTATVVEFGSPREYYFAQLVGIDQK